MKALNIYIQLLKAIMILFVLPTICRGQSVIEYGNFKIGDTVPDVLFKNLTRYNATEQKLSMFSEKLLIVDFWATWCSPCVGMLPRMDSLRREFKDDLIFISVTDQPQSYAEPFLEKVEKNSGKVFDIPVIYGDTTIRKLFPHQLLPHYVWLDVKAKKVLAISGLQHINKVNIESFIESGKLAKIPLKTDQRLDYDKTKPLLGYLSGMTDSDSRYLPIQYSSFWPYIPELKAGLTAHLGDSLNNNRITARNESKQQLIQYAFGEGRKFFQSNSIIVESKYKDRLHTNLAFEPFRKWRAENAINYEISVLPENRSKIFDVMRMDIINYFSEYDIRIEKRKANCLVLISTGSNEKIRSKGGKPKVIKDQFGYHATNITLDALFLDLSFYYLTDAPLLVNETEIDFNLDLDLDVLNFKELNQLNRALKKYELQFVEKEAIGEFLVISDR